MPAWGSAPHRPNGDRHRRQQRDRRGHRRRGSGGANVVIDYVARPEATDALEEHITARGGEATGVYADVSQVGDLERLVATAVTTFGRLDVMVNNAGIETRTSVLDTTEEDYDRVMAST